MSKKIFFLFCVLIATFELFAHPVPDIPVRAHLNDGELSIQIELDLRCLTDDPIDSPYVFNKDLKKWSDEKIAKVFEDAKAYVNERIKFTLNPKGSFTPDLKCKFMLLGQGELKGPDDVVVIAVEAKTSLEELHKTYSVKSTKLNDLSLEVMNKRNGKKIPRIATLFPGEKSYEWALIR